MIAEAKASGTARPPITVMAEGQAFQFPDGADLLRRKLRDSGSFYEADLLSYLALHKGPGVWAVDCGANIGNHTVYFAGLMGLKVAAFEPMDENADLLAEVLALNGLSDKVRIHRKAVSDAPTTLRLAMTHPGNPGTYAAGEAGHAVEAVRLDDVSGDLDGGIAVLKFDVEGHEIEALDGALKTIAAHKPLVAIELKGRLALNAASARLGGCGLVPMAGFGPTPTIVFGPVAASVEAARAIRDRVARFEDRTRFGGHGFSSADYWSQRYQGGFTSGAGSYGRLAVYKAHVVNLLVHRHRIKSVLEFGSGDGAQAALFAIRNYTGIDVASQVVEACAARFSDRPGWCFATRGAFDDPAPSHDMTMSLDVIYHLIEDEVFEAYMADLFDHARRYVLIYASDHAAAGAGPHVRHRAYSEWIAANRPGWRLAEAFEQPYPMVEGSNPKHTSFASFKLFERAQ